MIRLSLIILVVSRIMG